MAYSFESFTTMFLLMTRHWNEVATQELKKYGIKGAHGVYLMILNDTENMTASKLTKIAKRDKADVSRAIDAFVANGLVKLKGETNYRATIVLTAKGKRLIERISKKIRLFTDELNKGVTVKQRETMGVVLTKMQDNLREMYKVKE